jgi:serine protease Do
MKGRVVGVNSKILSTSGGSNGLSFSIPIDLAMDVVNQIKDTGQVERGYLGVNYQEVSYDLARSFGLEKSQGALINVVAPDSPAEKSGIKTGDIVLEIDGKTIKNSTELPFIIGRYRPGQTAQLNIVRQGKKMSLKVSIGSRNGAVAQNAPTGQSNRSSVEWLGAEFKNIPEEIISRTNITHGVIVAKIDTGRIYDAGIRQGDIIQSIQLKTVNSIQDLESVIAKLPEEGSVPILVSRPETGSQYLILDLAE